MIRVFRPSMNGVIFGGFVGEDSEHTRQAVYFLRNLSFWSRMFFNGFCLVPDVERSLLYLQYDDAESQ